LVKLIYHWHGMLRGERHELIPAGVEERVGSD
jgi:hypothetical protein